MVAEGCDGHPAMPDLSEERVGDDDYVALAVAPTLAGQYWCGIHKQNRRTRRPGDFKRRCFTPRQRKLLTVQSVFQCFACLELRLF
jgi:hypothetical protein